MLLVGIACGSPRAPGLDATTMGDGSSATSAPATSGGPGSMPPDQGGDDGSIIFDTPPEPGACDASETTLIDLDISSPSGEVAAMHAWWGWEYCCSPHPRIVLSEVAPAGICGIVGDVRPALTIEAREHLPVGSEWVGMHEAEVILCTSAHECSGTDISFEILEPLISPDYPSELEQPPLRASFGVAQDGWILSGSLSAAHCPGLDCPPCPCE